MPIPKSGLAVILVATFAIGAGATIATGQEAAPLPTMPPTGGVGPVSAQPAPLTEAQKAAIARSVREANRKVTVPPGVQVRVGAELPPSMELYMLPDPTLATIPEAKPYKYTVVEDRVLLVDPTTMKVVEVLPR
ncbi:DUF1236 domain-containing protein [Rhodoplanes serenus]|uniref:DUF1236 domain-containing protein n=1 Tax=Rhodoplanes serenus TaxID=200615 RepID=A0A9X5ATE3_9BRAD|nr:DUF1236 domain-containing protein [Rhodoplanes serenus]MTW18256.1 DUF1236 domain-containing protein [Rhodoplanes serenus]